MRHRNVVRVFGADSHEGRFGLWMELIPGRTLEQVLVMQGQMGMSEVIPIGIDLCHALAAVHGAGLLHRDLKARNVLREEGGRIVLMDFGTGRAMGGTDTSDDLAGTPLYLAPELFGGAKPSAVTDIYSLGVLLYHLVTGDYPVRGKTRDDVESAHRTAKRQPLKTRARTCPQVSSTSSNAPSVFIQATAISQLVSLEMRLPPLLVRRMRRTIVAQSSGANGRSQSPLAQLQRSSPVWSCSVKESLMAVVPERRRRPFPISHYQRARVPKWLSR